MLNFKYGWIFYPLSFLIFIWPYLMANGLDFGLVTLGAWRFLLATIALVLCAAVFFKKTWVAVLGFPHRIKQILACIIVGILSFTVFYFFIEFLLSIGGYQQLSMREVPLSGYFGRYPLLSWVFLRICQPLNEEIVLRALLLGFFASFFSHRAYLALIAALIFSGLHLLYYYFGPMTVRLELLTLLTLFFFAVAANALYLTFNHIGFGFVIHLAWNWWRFSGNIVKDGIPLNEAQGFNAIEGSTPAFIFVAMLSLVCVMGLVIHDAKIKRRQIKY